MWQWGGQKDGIYRTHDVFDICLLEVLFELSPQEEADVLQDRVPTRILAARTTVIKQVLRGHRVH